MSNTFIENVNSGPAITGSVSHSGTNYYPSDSKPGDGMLRIHGSNIEYYDAGNGYWMPMQGDTLYLEAGPEMNTVMNWAYRKMAEEERIRELSEKYPALAKAKENYDIVKALVENEN